MMKCEVWLFTKKHEGEWMLPRILLHGAVPRRKFCNLLPNRLMRYILHILKATSNANTSSDLGLTPLYAHHWFHILIAFCDKNSQSLSFLLSAFVQKKVFQLLIAFSYQCTGTFAQKTVCSRFFT